ncbi:hypothetical protein HK096_002883 [Nowakowskiella sp. JEL0078]|nr:hypothetical protein HK096_002883 [Nowakowskiella sp. JEL0078]
MNIRRDRWIITPTGITKYPFEGSSDSVFQSLNRKKSTTSLLDILEDNHGWKFKPDPKNENSSLIFSQISNLSIARVHRVNPFECEIQLPSGTHLARVVRKVSARESLRFSLIWEESGRPTLISFKGVVRRKFRQSETFHNTTNHTPEPAPIVPPIARNLSYPPPTITTHQSASPNPPLISFRPEQDLPLNIHLKVFEYTSELNYRAELHVSYNDDQMQISSDSLAYFRLDLMLASFQAYLKQIGPNEIMNQLNPSPVEYASKDKSRDDIQPSTQSELMNLIN